MPRCIDSIQFNSTQKFAAVFPCMLTLCTSLLRRCHHQTLSPLVTSRSLHRTTIRMTSVMAASGQENMPAAKVQRTEPPAPKAAPVEALRVRRTNEHALLPKRGSAGAAGYDLARWATAAVLRLPTICHATPPVACHLGSHGALAFKLVPAALLLHPHCCRCTCCTLQL